jgi:hypothetical protein
MGKRLTIFILVFLVNAGPIASGLGAGRVSKYLLRDGSVLSRVDGKLTRLDSNDVLQEHADRWFFEFDSEISDGRGRVGAGARLELLPSATLEKMSADAERRADVNVVASKSPVPTAASSERTSDAADYRLWARVTTYRNRNFIFPTDFLPLGKRSETPSPTSEESQQQESSPTESPPAQEDTEELAINEPNDVITVPQEILKKLEARKIGRKIAPAARREKELELKRDSVMVDRIGFISSRAMRAVRRVEWKEETRNAKGNTEYGFFVLDAFGRNIRYASGGFGLLPCEALEQAEEEQSEEVEPLRFKIAGIVTTYKGRQYLLLQRAARIYSYGNFPR